MFDISVRTNIKEVTKGLDAFARTQLPFATALALTGIAKRVQIAEQQNLEAVLDTPSPFTLKAVRVIPARKTNHVATVFVMDRAAEYLEPYERGGLHHLNSRALLNPKAITLNKYGQMPQGSLAKLKARPDVFIGKVKTKRGVVNGVWQRPLSVAQARKAAAGKALRKRNTTDKLKLLVRFGDALPVKQRLGYMAHAQLVVARVFDEEFSKAMSKALSTAK